MMWSPVLFLFLVLTDIVDAHKSKGCFPEAELPARAVKLLHRSHRNAESRRAGSAAMSCADFQRQVFSPELKHRSLSPWIIRDHHDSSLIPSSYQVAQCLCEGCIINGTENTDYNSVPVFQNMMFLKKVKCPTDSDKYSLQIHYEEIPYACTCAVPKQ
ncbi:interleukin-17C [Electrophorus electricus]|uniref:interleukin-17C n=1 Tax=Electrophorus electricus TaxID=8005 RepID=UPI000F0A5DB7|nr:interleukin-17C [Electrophorus electricus]